MVRQLLPFLAIAIALIPALGPARAAEIEAGVCDVGGIAAHRKAHALEKELAAHGIERMPVSLPALSEADHNLAVREHAAMSGLSESAGLRSPAASELNRELARFQALSARPPVPAKPTLTDGVYSGPKSHAKLGLFAADFDPPSQREIHAVLDSLREAKLDEVYVLVSEKGGAIDTRRKAAELAFAGQANVKFLDASVYRGKAYPEVLAQIAGKNARHSVSSISDDRVLKETYFGRLPAGNVRYVVLSSAEDRDMMGDVIHAKLGERLKQDPSLVTQLEAKGKPAKAPASSVRAERRDLIERIARHPSREAHSFAPENDLEVETFLAKANGRAMAMITGMGAYPGEMGIYGRLVSVQKQPLTFAIEVRDGRRTYLTQFDVATVRSRNGMSITLFPDRAGLREQVMGSIKQVGGGRSSIDYTSHPLVRASVNQAQFPAMAKELYAKANLFDMASLEARFANRPEAVREIADRWYGDAAPSLIEAMRKLPDAHQVLLLDPGIASRMPEFQNFYRGFTETHPGATAVDTRNAFARQLGTTTVYKGMMLTDPQLDQLKREGIHAGLFWRKNRSDGVTPEAATRSFFDETIENRGVGMSPAGFEQAVQTHQQGQTNLTPFISTSKYIEVSQMAGWDILFNRPQRVGQFYLLKLDVPTIDLVEARADFGGFAPFYRRDAYHTSSANGQAFEKRMTEPGFEILATHISPETVNAGSIYRYDNLPPGYSLQPSSAPRPELQVVRAPAAAPERAGAPRAFVGRELALGREEIAALESSRPAVAAAVEYGRAAAADLAEARRAYFEGRGSFESLERAERSYGAFGTLVTGKEESVRRLGYLAQEDNFLVREMAEAEKNGDPVALERAGARRAAVAADWLGASEKRAGEIAAGEASQEARRGVVESLGEMHQLDAEAMGAAAKEARSHLTDVLEKKFASVSATPGETSRALAEKLAQDLVDAHVQGFPASELAERRPERWTAPMVEECIDAGICSPKPEPSAKPVGERAITELKAHADSLIAAAPPEQAEEARRVTKLAPAPVEVPSPAPAPGSLKSRVEQQLAGIKALSPASRATLSQSLEAVAAFEKSEAGANQALRHLTALAANPDLFETFRASYEAAAKALPELKEWNKAWEEGVKAMLLDSGYTREEVMKIVDEASGTRLFQQTARCLKM